MSYSIQEKTGIIDLLQVERQNVYILYQLAKSVTKNVTEIQSEDEALNIIFLNIPDCMTLLNKRIITREVLFKYLYKKKVPLTTDFTKAILIKKIVDYWHQDYTKCTTNSEAINTSNVSCNDSSRKAATNAHVSPNASATVEECSEFPIHLLARKFSEWFFDNYNKNALKLNDFWSDASLMLQIAANDGINEQSCQESTTLLKTLLDTRQLFGFYFNPNLTHAGVQGRMDIHGLVLVLACGTLHTEKDCVGVFECIFGLLRDPFAENNWKTKNIKLILRSKGAPAIPSLKDSDAFKEALELPIPQGDLT